MKKSALLLLTAGIGAAIHHYNNQNKKEEPKEEDPVSKLAGNDEKYHLENVDVLPDSPLKGKHLAFLGSSVTFGFRSLEVSFVEYIAKRNECTYVKEAVSGTTLVDNGEKSYVQRMLNNIDKDEKFDAFVCQLSTNDMHKNLPMGTITDEKENFDTSTIAGATAFIIKYAKDTWNCPVIFYTSAGFGREVPQNMLEMYDNMVKMLYTLKEKWGIEIIDLWNDEKLNDITDDKRELYMADPVHPTQAGYLLWWTPVIEKKLYEFVK